MLRITSFVSFSHYVYFALSFDEKIILPSIHELRALLNFRKMYPQLLRIRILRNFILQCYVRALFNYDPIDDSLLPCEKLGLEFKIGDILQVLEENLKHVLCEFFPYFKSFA